MSKQNTSTGEQDEFLRQAAAARLNCDIGRKLSKLRKKVKLTQSDWISMFSYYFEFDLISSVSTVSCCEHGKTGVSLLVLKALHDYYGVDLNELIAGENVDLEKFAENFKKRSKFE